MIQVKHIPIRSAVSACIIRIILSQCRYRLDSLSHHTTTNITQQRFVLVIGKHNVRSCLKDTFFQIQLALQSITLVICTFHSPVLIGVSHTGIISGIFSTTFYRKIIVLHQRRIEHDVLPVIVFLISQILSHLQRR